MMKQNSTAKNSVRTRQQAELKRAGQQRAQETRSAILDAALLEFASRRFDATSIRRIADRMGVQHPLITYHFRSKEILWQAVAEYVFERVRSERDANLLGSDSASAVERVKLAYRALFRFSVEYPEFHRFMLQEEPGHSSRLQWIADTILKPLIAWLLPQIRAAQDEHALPKVEPIIFHYMLVSLTSTVSGFGPEISATSNLSASDPALVDACWRTIEQIVFKTSQASRAPARM
jgi:TetR/AcrR family transcriptional regulator